MRNNVKEKACVVLANFDVEDIFLSMVAISTNVTDAAIATDTPLLTRFYTHEVFCMCVYLFLLFLMRHFFFSSRTYRT